MPNLYFSRVVFSVLLLSSTAWADAPLIPAPPTIAAPVYLLMDASSGSVLLEQNADTPRPPASLTKMMTSYIAVGDVEKGKLKETDLVHVSEDAWRRGGAVTEGSTMFLEVNSDVSVIDLLRGVIIQSGNDASIALAEHIAGSEPAFADIMNQQAKQLGMNNTHFENATGLPGNNHTTTARDLAILARAVINDHPSHYSLYAERWFNYKGHNQPNRNRLLFRDSTVDGLKTGHTSEAGFCLVASAKRNDMRLITVVLGSASEESRAVESQNLLAYGFRYFEGASIFQKSQELASARVWKGKANKISLGVDKNVNVTIQRGGKDRLTVQTTVANPIVAPVNPGQELGQVVVSLDGKEIYKGPLVAMTAVEQTGIFGRLWDSLMMLFAGV
ncbi:MAG TPA: D-alanyl-D-alanine carboxypeptidase family protein [Cellvibrionaceae bacterium]